MKFNQDAFEQLEKRGFVFQITHLEETKKLLKEKPITFYIGIDPTADDLHIGHFFGLQMARTPNIFAVQTNLENLLLIDLINNIYIVSCFQIETN